MPPVFVEPIENMTQLFRDKGTADCMATVPVRLAQNNALVESYALKEEPLHALSDEFKKAFNFEPDIEAWLLAPAQCPFAKFMATALTDKAKAVPITLNATNLRSGQPLSGTLQANRERIVELLHLSDGGLVQNIPGVVSSATSKSFNANFQRPPQPGGGKLQLVIAITSTAPLQAARIAKPTPADKFFPALAAEIAQKGQPVGVSIKGFNLD